MHGFIGPRPPYVRRKKNPVKPARRAKRRAKQITEAGVEKRRYTTALRRMASQ